MLNCDLTIIIAIVVFGMSAFVADGSKCLNSKDMERLVVVNCAFQEFKNVPNSDILKDVETLHLEHNYIGKLLNDSFVEYPNIKKLIMTYNKIHTIEPGSLGLLGELEMLDLSQNAIKEVPAGLPKSLVQLKLNENPVLDMEQLSNAVGLQVLQLRNCDLKAYPALGIMPNLVNLDVSENNGIEDLDPAHLAVTCRLARLNVTGANKLFRPGTPGAHCRCQRVVQWAHTYKVTVYGLSQCPDPLAADGEVDIHDDPKSEACTRAPDRALVAFKECMAEWEHRNTPYWAIGFGLFIVVGVLLALCVCLRRRRRRRRRGNADKVQSGQSPPPPSDAKVANNDSAAGNNKTEPAALLSTAT